jgi:hypothetical protein
MLDLTEGNDDLGAGRTPECAAGYDDAESTAGVSCMTSDGDDMERTVDVAVLTTGIILLTPASST